MRENTNEQHKMYKPFIALLSLLLAALLAGCGDSSAKEGDTEPDDQAIAEETADEPEENGEADEANDTNEANADEKKKEDLPTAEELEAEYGVEFEHPERELVDITEEVKITQVLDGDTVVVEGENGEETVELLLVDTPETTLPDGSEDVYYGFKSNEYTQRLVGSSARLERGEPGTDEDDHTLGYLWMENNYDFYIFNKMLVEDGLARVSVTEPNTKYLDEFEEAEAAAKAEHKNIWSIDGYVTDDGFDSSLVQS